MLPFFWIDNLKQTVIEETFQLQERGTWDENVANYTKWCLVKDQDYKVYFYSLELIK